MATKTIEPKKQKIPAKPDNPFNIGNFVAHVGAQNEFAYANKFNVYIMVPKFLQSLDYGRELVLSCENAELPGVEINQIEFRHYSFIQRIPSKVSFAPITLLFYCTGKMMEKQFFDAWADNIVPFHTGLVSYPSDSEVYSTITVNQYNLQGDVSYSVDLIDAYPIAVSPVILNWADDSVNKLQVTFAFKKWLSNQTTKAVISDGNNEQPINGVTVNNTNNTTKPGS